MMVTDIHAHVLPDLDDGPRNVAETTQLLQAFHESGTERVICTTHFGSPYYDVPLSAIDESFKRISTQRGNVPLLTTGAEVRIRPSLGKYIQKCCVPTLGNTKYVLVEFPSHRISSEEMEYVHELTIRGYVPIMAHPERNAVLQRKPYILDELMALGMHTQVTAQCFVTSGDDKLTQTKFAWKLLEQGRVTVIASDAHNTSSRPPGLLEAYDNISIRLNCSAVEQLLNNANAVWNGHPISEVSVPAPKRRFFSRTQA
jgi:protein-tyrosine phosphatase